MYPGFQRVDLRKSPARRGFRSRLVFGFQSVAVTEAVIGATPKIETTGTLDDVTVQDTITPSGDVTLPSTGCA